MKKNAIAEVVSALLLVFYVHSVISTYVQLQSLKNMLAFYALNTSLFAWGIVVVELLIAALIFGPRSRLIGFVLSAIFAITLITTIELTAGYPHDFGGVINMLSTTPKLLLLIVIAILSFLGVGLTLRKQKGKQQTPGKVIYT